MNKVEFADFVTPNGYDKKGRSEYALVMDNVEHTHDFSFAALVLTGRLHLATAE